VKTRPQAGREVSPREDSSRGPRAGLLSAPANSIAGATCSAGAGIPGHGYVRTSAASTVEHVFP
jgi:hypothetical protein